MKCMFLNLALSIIVSNFRAYAHNDQIVALESAARSQRLFIEELKSWRGQGDLFIMFRTKLSEVWDLQKVARGGENAISEIQMSSDP